MARFIVTKSTFKLVFSLVTSVSDFFISIISVFNKLVSCFKVCRKVQFSDKIYMKNKKLEISA